MKNQYYQQTIELLSQSPDGMKLCNIARQVYNANSSLFEEDDLYKKIYYSLKRFLWKQSKMKSSPFTSVNDKWGYYKIRQSFSTQFELEFDCYDFDIPQPKPKPEKKQINTPGLFGW